MNKIQKLYEIGQSIWYDNIERSLIEDGSLKAMIENGDIYGVTSNPSIFEKAIRTSNNYDESLQLLSWAGWDSESVFNQIATEDIIAVCDLLIPIYEKTKGDNGYVSIEVSPMLAYDSEGTVKQAKEIWHRINRPNVMIKIPSTLEGLSAITEVIASGINVNVTLIFSVERYKAVMEAYLNGLKERIKQGLPINDIFSVASFFISRIDSKIDPLLRSIINEQNEKSSIAESLIGDIAISNAAMAYEAYKSIFNSNHFKELEKSGAKRQKPLWASTSTKNPNYSNTKYVDNLIARGTINTAPPETIVAFKEQGNLEISLEEKALEAKSALNKLSNLGINFEYYAGDLEKEGVDKFKNAYVSLLSTITKRSDQFKREIFPLEIKIDEKISIAQQDRVIERLYESDPSLWTSNNTQQSEIRNRLGWLNLPEKQLSLVNELSNFRNSCIEKGFKFAFVLGMGGSSLAAEVMSLTLTDKVQSQKGLKLEIIDSTNPDEIIFRTKNIDLSLTLFIVSSKSGTTSETLAYFNYFWAELTKIKGNKAGENFIAITDPGTSLESLAKELNFLKVFNARPDVGGRFSVFTMFGLVPAALMGIDLSKLLNSASRLSSHCQVSAPLARNPGYMLGLIMGQAAINGRDKLTIIADDEVSPLGPWLEQLIAESSGKEGKGILPIVSEPLLDASKYARDRLFVYLRYDGAYDKLTEQLKGINQPVITINFLDVYDLGKEFYRWEFAIAIACSILNINAFDQPNVQDNKIITKQKIEAYKAQGKFLKQKPIWSSKNVDIFGSADEKYQEFSTVEDLIKYKLDQLEEGSYVALNAYLPRTPEFTSILNALREKILKYSSKATTLGFGPRFLHSTGQLHKGGSDSAFFIQITQDVIKDLDIPEQEISFGALLKAQALGDFEALMSRKRNVLSLHLKNGLED